MNLETIRELNGIKTEIEILSSKIIARASKMTEDVITIRNDPIITDLWSNLCSYHRKAMLLCAGMGENKPEICAVLEKPQACVETLRLSKEEICCEVFKRRLRNKKRKERKIKYLISSPVITVNLQATVADIIRLMKKHGIGSLIVVDKGKIKGIVTEHDIISKVHFMFSKNTLAQNIMTKSPIFTLKVEADIKEGIEMMSKHNIKHLPVVEDGELAGMLAVPDFY